MPVNICVPGWDGACQQLTMVLRKCLQPLFLKETVHLRMCCAAGRRDENESFIGMGRWIIYFEHPVHPDSYRWGRKVE